MSYYKEYFSYQDKYEKIYGANKTLVVMKIGSFYEICSFEKNINFKKISKKMELEIVTINNTSGHNSLVDIYTLVFPAIQFERYKNILNDIGFTVVVLDEVVDLNTGEQIQKISDTYIPPKINIIKMIFRKIWKKIKRFFKKINCSKKAKVVYA